MKDLSPRKEELDPIEIASIDEIRALQLERLKWSVRHAYDNVPMYRQRFDAAGVHPDDLKQLSDLAKFPFTYKSDLRDNYPFGLFAVPRDQIIRVHASSGTTGKPKGIFMPPHTDQWDAPLGLTTSIGAAFGFGPETTYLSPAPLYHAAPLNYNMIVFDSGGTSVVMEKFDAVRALELIEEHRVTHSQWVPIMFVRMLKLAEETRRAFDLSSMQIAIHAAAPCPIDVKEKMIDWWGPIIVEYYSSSEGAGFTLIDSNDWLAHKGSVGRPLFGVPHILDDDGNELAPGDVGTIWFSEIYNKFEYHNEPEKTSEVYNKEGWTTIGDVGYLDEDGYLYLTDRRNFTIITGGVNVYPAEIESVLIGHERVADVAVFGVPDEEFGEIVQAVVQPAQWADASDDLAAELIAWLKERLSVIKVPKRLDFTEQLPRMDNGKLYKRHLMEAYRNRDA